MLWKHALRAHLVGHPGVHALVGDRVEPSRLEYIRDQHLVAVPDDRPMREMELPAITYRRVSTRYRRTHSGPSALINPRVQINCFGLTHDDAEAVGDAVIAALHGFRGTMGGITYVGSGFVDGDMDDFEPSAELQRRVIDVMLNLNEEVA